MICPFAIWEPGPTANTYAGDNPGTGVVLHSAEGRWSDTYRPPDTMKQQGVSWHFTVEQDGSLWQHMPMTARAWHAGSTYGNFNLIGIEHEGVKGEPLTPLQLQASVRLVKWIAGERGWKPERGKTLFEHRELSQTTCPNDRIPWEAYEEEDMKESRLNSGEKVAAAIGLEQALSEYVADAINIDAMDGWDVTRGVDARSDVVIVRMPKGTVFPTEGN